MTYNETKFLHWFSSTSRSNNPIWSRDFEIDDITTTYSTHLMLSEPTLATSCIANHILQVTPSGIYFNNVFRRQMSSHQRVVQASVAGNDVIWVVYSDPGEWTLWCVSFVVDDSGEGDVEGTMSYSGRQIQLPSEPTAIRLVHFRLAPSQSF